MMEIPELRKKIDTLDAKILALLTRRAALVLAIGQVKKSRGLAVRDAAREAEVFARLEAQCSPSLPAASVRKIFKTILAESRRLEKRVPLPAQGRRMRT